MSNSALHHKITYIEFTTTSIERTKEFYSTVFGWSFKDWGPDYIDCNAAESGSLSALPRAGRKRSRPSPRR